MATQQTIDMESPKSDALVPKQPTSMDLINVALSNNAAIDVIERLAALREKEMDRDAELQFTEAMNAAQSELGRVGADLNNKQTNSKYASYAALDRKIRPIYSKHGFSLSFDTAPDAPAESVIVLCYVSHRGGHTRTYRTLMPADCKGAKGGDVMTKTHATGAAMSYGMRYLLKMIFNIAVGEEDDDGNLNNGWLAERLEWIQNCRNLEELKRIFQTAFKEAQTNKSGKAMLALVEASDKRKAELQ